MAIHNVFELAALRFRIGESDLELFGNEKQTSRDKKALETR